MNDHELGQNLFAIVVDEHNFGCDGPDCQQLVLVGGVERVCSETQQ